MDLASLIGFVGAIGAILAAMIAGGGIAPFIDTQSIMIVFGGTFFAVMYAAPLPVFSFLGGRFLLLCTRLLSQFSWVALKQ